MFNIQLHLVWVTKYRYQVRRGDVALRARDVIRQVCMAREIKIMRGHVGRDHVHVLVSVPPSLSVSQVMPYVKGKSGRILRQESTELRKRYWGQPLWARGYFCASSGAVTGEMVKAYIASQDVPPDDGFRVADERL